MKYLAALALLLIVAACHSGEHKIEKRSYLDLSGTWQFALDSANTGISGGWFKTALPDSIPLPGTTDAAGKGFLNRDTTTLHLNRVYRYEGAAWYRRSVTIPESFANRTIVLKMERTKTSRIWVDSTLVGGSRILQSPQVFDLTALLTPGEHSIAIRIDNRLDLTPYGNVHIYSDETQTNWNGILGEIGLIAMPHTHITRMRVFPDLPGQKVAVEIGLRNPGGLDSLDLELIVADPEGHLLPGQKIRAAADSLIAVDFPMGDEIQLWDEFQQPLYRLTAILSAGEEQDAQSTTFAMRSFEARGTQFAVNGRTTFLRGKHDAAVFPLTGHPPMDVDGWRGLYRIAKNWGINHYRFHSWCPPEAAFTAADLEGIYLQAELPFWGGLESDSVAALLRAEGLAMLDAYGNHPSLVMFSHGNEIWSGHERVEANIIALKEHDPRPLYTMGSNNNIGYVPPRPCCDFFVCARTPFEKDTTLTHTRLTHAYVDSRDGGILNTRTPSTQVNFDVPVSRIDIPLISHEIGQYQVFPDYREIDKYTGVLRAWNLEVFRKRLAKAGMADLGLPFHRASGAWSALCYKAEMEAALRTAGMGGFQLLDLQDFPGQGTALVGMLDAFMDSKGIITPEQWRESCDAVVLLMEFPKYCWTSGETLAGTAAVANYGPVPLRGDIAWHLRRADGTVMAQGLWANPIAPAGGLSTIGRFEAALPELRHPEKLRLEIALSGGSITNSYPLWVYPAAPPPAADEVLVSQTLSDQARSVLAAGGKILLFPRGEELGEGAIPGLFPPDFWNYGMFKGISEWAKKPVSPGTLGLLTDPGHPLFGDFPTDFHSNWQWFSIVRGGYAMVLDDLPAGYRPIVQVIDNLERNHKLGLIFECRVGAGKLLVCMAPLDRLAGNIEAVWLYRSILNYMNSAAFVPEQELDPALLGGLF